MRLSIFLICFGLLSSIEIVAQTTSTNDSIHSLGLDYFHGRNGKFMNRDKGVALVLEAAELGNTKALCNAGILYTEGIYVQKNDSLAASYFVKAATLGDPDAMDKCGLRFAEGIGVKQNNIVAYNYFLDAANLGHSNGAFNLAVCYQNGEGTEQNFDEALKWYRFAAEHDHAKAQHQLAKLYYLGELGARKDLEQSCYWAKIAGQNGIMDALNLYGVLIKDSNPIDAFEAFKNSYKGKDYYGRRNYADALRDGMGCEKDLTLSSRIYMEGCEDEDLYCMYHLGVVLFENDVTINLTDAQLKGGSLRKFAENLLRHSAECGFEDAQVYCKNHKIKYKHSTKQRH